MNYIKSLNKWCNKKYFVEWLHLVDFEISLLKFVFDVNCTLYLIYYIIIIITFRLF
jgi:hypothetical protein